MSTATTGASAPPVAAIASATAPLGAPLDPVPSSPSSTRSAPSSSRPASSAVNGRTRPPAARTRATQRSPCSSRSSGSPVTSASAPAPRRASRASASRASPPLCPLPARATTRRPATVPSSRTAAPATAAPARPISTSTGVPPSWAALSAVCTAATVASGFMSVPPGAAGSRPGVALAVQAAADPGRWAGRAARVVVRALDEHAGVRGVPGVGQGEVPAHGAQQVGPVGQLAGELDRGGARGQVGDLDLGVGEPREPDPERLGGRLLGGPPLGQVGDLADAPAGGRVQLGLGVDALAEAGVALQGTADPGDLDGVDPDPDDHRTPNLALVDGRVSRKMISASISSPSRLPPTRASRADTPTTTRARYQPHWRPWSSPTPAAISPTTSTSGMSRRPLPLTMLDSSGKPTKAASMNRKMATMLTAWSGSMS